MTKLAISHMCDCIVSTQFRVVPSSVTVQSTFGSIEEVVLFVIAPGKILVHLNFILNIVLYILLPCIGNPNILQMVPVSSRSSL